MSISFGSINTGLPKDIVNQIMTAEKVPLMKMESRKGKIEEKSKLVSDLTELVRNLQGDIKKNASPKDLREFSVLTNNDIIDTSIDKNLAEVGEYQFEVVELAQKSSAMTTGFSNPDTSYVGVGYIQYYTPEGETRSIYVDSNNSSLKSIAKLINNSPEMRLRANVINDGSGSDTPWRIVLSQLETGEDNFADFPYLYFVDGEDDFSLEMQREARNAKVKLDGFEIELQKNKTSDVIPGLTIDLKKAKPGEEFSIKITENIKAIAEKVEIIIKKINEVLQFIHVQNKLDEKSDTTRTLGGDSTLQSIETRIRNAVINPVVTRT
jgi:flagellar hook-associated protein 2